MREFKTGEELKIRIGARSKILTIKRLIAHSTELSIGTGLDHYTGKISGSKLTWNVWVNRVGKLDMFAHDVIGRCQYNQAKLTVACP